MKTHFRRFRRGLLAAANHRCFYCGVALAFEGNDRLGARDWLFLAVSSRMSGEHQNPLTRGGTHSRSNVVASCRGCNAAKGTRTLEEFRFLSAFRNQRWPYRFFAEERAQPRDVLFVATEVEKLMRHNFGRPKKPRREVDTCEIRRSILQ